MKRLYLILLVIGLLTIFNCYQPAYAEIALAPLTKTIQVAPGKSQIVNYTIANEGDKPIEVTIRAEDWFVLPENKEIGISDWLNLGINKITLAKDEKKELEFKVTVPKEAIGELAGMIYFQPIVEEGATIVTSYGTSLYVFVKGTEIVDVKIGDILFTSREEENYITVEVLNKGNVHIRPHIKALIENKEGLQKEIDLPFGKPIFGGETFTFVGEIKDLTLQKGVYKTTAFVDYGNKENIITKTIEIKVDGGGE